MCDERQGILVRKSGEAYSGNFYASSFLWKIKISPTHCRNLKCDAGQEIWSWPTRPGDISQQKIPQLDTWKKQADWSRNSRENFPLLIAFLRSKKRKFRDYANEVKLKGLVKNPGATDRCLNTCAKNTGSWMTIRGNMVTSKLLVSMYFHGFCACVIMSTP